MTLRIQKCLRRGASALSISVGFAALLASAPAHAQKDPKFDFGKQEEVKVVEWKAQAKGGFSMTTGNSQTTNGTVTGSVSRKEGNNKLALEAGAAYGRANNRVANIDMATNTYSIDRPSVTSTNNYYGKGRYDRFFTANNAAYVSGQAAADKIAGKTFFGGGQIGYSRQLYKSEMHLAVVEAGYDFSYERYVQPATGKPLDPVSIHSARLFAGETLKLSAATGATASVEALFNLNKEGAAIDVNTSMAGVDAFKDIRVNGKLGLTTTVYKQLSIGFSFTLKYDQNPAPLPAPANVGTATAAGAYFVDKVDTLSEISLIMTFL
jgi:hypothetical protein